MIRKLAPSFAFGGIDGAGLAIGLLLVLGRSAIIAAVAANAASDFASMSSGEWLSRRGEPLRIPNALVNGVASAIGALLPVFAFVVAGRAGAITALCLWVIFLSWVMPSKPWWRSWVETGACVAFVTLAATLAMVIVK